MTQLVSAPVLAIIVPCYNEEQALPQTAAALTKLLDDARQQGLAAPSSYLCFVDDGSSDRSWARIRELAERSSAIRGLKLARNFGHQAAVLAGMFDSQADAVVTIDADLQDDERCILEMLRKYRDGCEVVLGVRGDRSSDTLRKRLTAELYYRLLRALGVKVVFNHADYRLVSAKAVGFLREYSESNLFLRGMVPLVGLRSEIVQYARRERTAGESKYSLRAMLSLAWNGVTSFSISPLRLVSGIGALISVGALFVTFWAIYERLFGTGIVPGWASTVVPIYFLGGVQILCLGVIGEYIGKIYLETKRRPRYLVDERIGGSQRLGPPA